MSQAAGKEGGQTLLGTWWKNHRGLMLLTASLAALPFVLALMTGQPMASLLANETGQAKFYQGVAIEIFILAVYALSYDLLFGITGLLSLGHAMFFGVGAYLTGIMIRSFGWSLPPTLGLVVLAGILMALLFSVVLPRVKGMTFALVTLGLAQVFHIVIQSRELVDYAGGEIGLQGLTPPAWINPIEERLRFYFVALAFMILIFLLYRRFVDSPTGHVCIAIRENEDRATMLGFNTFYFKLAAMTISAITAALAGSFHALFSPIIRPGITGSEFTIAALLMVLIGGIGTLSGAIIGAASYTLLSFFFQREFGELSQVLIGVIYILIVLFFPYGIVGTWRMRSFDLRRGRRQLLDAFRRSLGLKKGSGE
ncbi:MAG: branched-chain amino acid ABC transporter permease [Anaerolineales bacterium]